MTDDAYWRNLEPAYIRAEVQRRRSTLTQIALDAGLAEAACRVALIRTHVPGEVALARFLGIPVEVLFASRYARRQHPTRRGRRAQRQSAQAG